MADVVGARMTDNVEQGIRKIDLTPTIRELEPSATPLTLFTTMMESKDTGSPEFKWYTDDLPPRFDAIDFGAGYDDNDTSIVVDNGPYFAVNELVKVTRTGEVFRITGIVSDTLTVVRGVGGGAAAILDNDELYRISSAHAENAVSGEAKSQNPTPHTNYTEIVRDWVEASETWRHSDNETRPDDWTRQRNKKMIEHKLKLEGMYWHGKPSEDTTGAPLRTTAGVYHVVQSNHIDAGGAFTEDEFFGAFDTAFRYGDKNAKVGFASRLASGIVNQFPRNSIRVINGDNDSTYGLNVMRYVSNFGTLRLVTHDGMEGSVYGGHIVILDMSQLKKRPLRGRDTHMKENVQPRDQDGRKDEILSEVGLEWGEEKTHTIISGISSAG
jgi:hypothetical protein